MAMMNDSSLSHSRASSCSKLPHSHSTPVGVDGGVGGCSRTPPTTPKKGGKMLAIRVQMMDDSVTMFQVQAKAVGRVLFDQVCKQLHLLEADYFGLEYQDSAETRYWLDLEKPLARQVGLTLVDPLLYFCVKFYTPDPAQLEEEFTRYLFCLQIKRDLAQGHIQCNENTAALMASYIVQAECGDYVAEDYPDASYLSTYKFVPHQDRDLERRIMENHKKHAGQSPAEADLNLLETARRCELYGMKMHPAKDHEGVPLNISVAHMGIVVFQNYTKINTFSWAKIRKISFKRKRFLIKLHPEGYGYYKDTVEFFFEGRNECKNFWKKCVENHGFFRCSAVKKVPRQRTRVLSRGSSFRYSGKTQKQIVEFVRENYVKRQTFQRSQSFRHSSSVHSSVATNVGGSISAHPLLPLGDSSIVSLSCGSMSLAGAGPVAGSQSPIARRQQAMTNQQMTTAIAERTAIDSRATFTPGQPYTSSPQSSLTESYCRHCGEGFDSLPSSRRSSTRAYKENRSSQTDIVDIEDFEEPVTVDKRYMLQRSASCKELIGEKTRPMEVKIERTDAPVTRYDESQRSCYSIAGSKTPSLDRSGVETVETKVYSSSYPGTTSSLSTESGGNEDGGLEPGGSVLVIDTGSSREEMILSHDDLSHDSYELLEREDLFGESRSCSLDSTGDQMPDDEMFVMDDDFSGHNGSTGEVEKRLGYVEPRFGDLDFKEFNEKCKQGFANRRAVEFGEFDAKCKPGMVIGFDDEVHPSGSIHYPVERTKSDPYVSDFWRVARQHRARLLHQKSIDLTPTEPTTDAFSYLGDDMKSSSLDIPCGSKSAVDISYTLHKRHQLNGTESVSPQLLSPRKLSPVSGRRSPIKSPKKEMPKSPKRQVVETDPLSKTKTKPDLNSQDSGLSLSVGTESADDLRDVFLKNATNFDHSKDVEEDIQLKKAVDEIISESLLAQKNLDQLESEKDKVPKMVSREVSTENEVNTNLLQVPDDVQLRPKPTKKDLVKGKSEDSKTKKSSLSKSRQIHSADGGLRKDSSFEKRDSAVKVIKIDSDDGLCHCDKKDRLKSSSLDSSDPDVIIVEYRGNRKRAFQKRSSSGSKGSKDSVDKDIKRSSSLDAAKDGRDKKDVKPEKGKDGKLTRSKSDGKEEKKKGKPDQKKPSIKKDEPKMDFKNEIQVEVDIETNRRSFPLSGSTEPVDLLKPQILVKPQIPTKPLKLMSGEPKVQSAVEKSIKTPNKPLRSLEKPLVADKPQKIPEKKFQAVDAQLIQIEKPKDIGKPLPTNERKETPQGKNFTAASKYQSNNGSGATIRDFRDLNLTQQKEEKTDTKKTITSPDTSWKKFGDLPAPISHKRERSPVLFARLGLSEGSAYSPTHRQSSVTSPSSSRRCKSLDAPVVSLHRLPPVTSFSSKDDTLDNEEDVELEEKTLRSYKSGLKGSNVCLPDSIIEERSPEGKETPENERNVDEITNHSNTEKEIVSNINFEKKEQKEYGIVASLELTKVKNQDDITVTLEKLDEVVDRVQLKQQNTHKKGTHTDILQEEEDFESNTIQSGLNKASLPPLSPVMDRASSPIKDLPPSPFKSPMSPSRTPLSPGALSPVPLSPSALSPTPSSPKPPLSPTIIEPPLSPSAERRPSTRQERLDSFKNTKSYSVDIWTSDEGENQPIPALEIEDIDFTSKDYEDETFIIENEDETDNKETKLADDIKQIESGGSDIMDDHQESPKHNVTEVVSTTEDECWVSVEDIRQIGEDPEHGEAKNGDNQDNEDRTDRSDSLKVELDENTDVSKVLIVKDSEKLEKTIKDFMEVIEPLDEPSTSGIRMIPEKRSFDDEPSSSSSIKQVELSSTWKPFPLESSGSSSLEEAIFPPDDTGHYADEEEGSSHSNGQDDFPSGFGYSMTGAEMIISGYTGGMFGLSRTLSRISERSTTSEQERSDFEDDISTKPSSRSLSVDDESLLSSDRQPSLSSDPPSGPNPEDQPLPELPPLPKEPEDDMGEEESMEGNLGFKIPPPLMPVGEDEWPSPPNSSPFDTPVISHVEMFYMDLKPEEATKVVVDSVEMENEGEAESDTDENKTLQEEFTGGFDEPSVQEETTVKLAKRPKTSSGMYANSASEDTSVGVSDFSSSTSTVKHCQYYSCAVKSDDSSLAGDFGLSLSTEMLSSRKGSADSVDTFQQKRGSGIFKVSQRSFDDYDSPYSESDDGQSKPPPKQRMAPHSSSSYYSNVSSPTNTTAPKQKVERSKFSRSGLKSTPYYSTPTPVSHEHRDVSELLERRDRDRDRSSKSIARSKCYSYYSLARSPPSDGSSSSLDNPEPPSTPNTIPRVSKRKRHIPPAKRRHRVSVDMDVRDGNVISVSSPSIVGCGRNRHQIQNSSQRDLQVIDPARQHSLNLSKQSSV